MKKLVDFIEKYSIDKSFYCRVHDIYSREEWEISWNKGESKEFCWGLKPVSDPAWKYYSGEEFVNVVSFNKLDVIALELELQAKVKNMIVFVNLMLKEAKKMMGDDIVEVSLAEYDEFAQSLMDTINKLLPGNRSGAKTKSEESVKEKSPDFPKTALRLVQADPESNNPG